MTILYSHRTQGPATDDWGQEYGHMPSETCDRLQFLYPDRYFYFTGDEPIDPD